MNRAPVVNSQARHDHLVAQFEDLRDFRVGQRTQICTIKVTFKPTAAGTTTGSIDAYDQWAGSPAIVALKGTGTN